MTLLYMFYYGVAMYAIFVACNYPCLKMFLLLFHWYIPSQIQYSAYLQALPVLVARVHICYGVQLHI